MMFYATDSRAVNSFNDHGEFVAMKMLSGCRAPHCDKHQFWDKMLVSPQRVRLGAGYLWPSYIAFAKYCSCER